ncbi:MAG: carbon-nitrogen hydrolase family protein, partial [Acidimicrobiales bacterium]
AAAGELVEEAARSGAELVVLPEYFSVAGSPAVLRAAAEHLEGPTISWASDLARRHGIGLVAGSFPERPAPGAAADGRVFNTSCLIGPAGSVDAVYRKIHLFDADIEGTALRESATIAPGTSLCIHPIRGGDGAPPAPVLGLSICYDLRFPELYRIMALSGATVVAVPAAFTAATGPAHWEVLLRARAIENGIFVIAAGQVGELPPGMPACHGHSMIVDPWGSVMAERLEQSPGVVLADLDPDRLRKIRHQVPVLANRRPSTYRWPDDSTRGASEPGR